MIWEGGGSFFSLLCSLWQKRGKFFIEIVLMLFCFDLRTGEGSLEAPGCWLRSGKTSIVNPRQEAATITIHYRKYGYGGNMKGKNKIALIRYAACANDVVFRRKANEKGV